MNRSASSFSLRKKSRCFLILIFFLSKELLDRRFKSNVKFDETLKGPSRTIKQTISNLFSQSSPLYRFVYRRDWPDEWPGRVHERDKWLNGRVFRLVDYWIEVVVYTARHLRECRVALGIQLVLASSRNRGQPAIYIYMGSYLTERWNRPTQSIQRCAGRGKILRAAFFSIQSFRRPRFLPQFRARIDRPAPPNLFSLPPEPLLDFPPLTQPFKTRFKKAGILLWDRKKEWKREERTVVGKNEEFYRKFHAKELREIIFRTSRIHYNDTEQTKQISIFNLHSSKIVPTKISTRASIYL